MGDQPLICDRRNRAMGLYELIILIFPFGVLLMLLLILRELTEISNRLGRLIREVESIGMIYRGNNRE
jgi:hypothetical protein